MAKSILQPHTVSANPSRRSALGVLATAPIAVLPALAVMQCSTPADAAIISTPEWDRAATAHRIALAAHEAYKRDHYAPILKTLDRFPKGDARRPAYAEIKAAEDKEGELHIAAYHAACEAFHVPSPSFAALDEKLAWIDRYHGGDDFDAPWDNLSWIRADVRRLAKMGA